MQALAGDLGRFQPTLPTVSAKPDHCNYFVKQTIQQFILIRCYLLSGELCEGLGHHQQP